MASNWLRTGGRLQRVRMPLPRMVLRARCARTPSCTNRTSLPKPSASLKEVGLECRVELWGGCAFINFDDDAPPLRQCIEPFATTLDAWHADTLRTEWWLAFHLPVNWKLAMEAFMEGYHVMQTHPQLLPSSARGKGSVYNSSGKSYQSGARPTKEAQAAATIGMKSQEFIENRCTTCVCTTTACAASFTRRTFRSRRSCEACSSRTIRSSATPYGSRRLNEAIVEWNRSAGMDIPDLNALAEQGVTGGVILLLPISSCFPG